jgi:hypothetical protein
VASPETNALDAQCICSADQSNSLKTISETMENVTINAENIWILNEADSS